MGSTKVIIGLAVIAVVFSYCSNSKKAVGGKTASATSVTFERQILPIIQEKCGPCHIPSKGGKVEALDNIEETKHEIDDIIRRISLEPGQRGYMPVNNPKLSDAEIELFKKWKETGAK